MMMKCTHTYTHGAYNKQKNDKKSNESSKLKKT